MDSIKVNYKFTSNNYEAATWLNELPPLVACDFEVASRFTETEKEQFKLQLETEIDFDTARQLKQYIASDGLSHPSLTALTHLSIAWSESDAIVIILRNDSIRRLVLRWLVTTDRIQIWHNFSFDGKLIYYHTGKFPKRYEDSQQLAKSIVNHVDTFKARTGLKELCAHKYGKWAVSADNFTIEQMFNEDVIEYAAIDSAATYWLWEALQRHLKEANNEAVP